MSGRAIRAVYRNWRGEIAERHFVPRRLYFGATEWHPEPQWLIEADTDKGPRDFALRDCEFAALSAAAETARANAMETEMLEQARLVGMGAERELALMARADRAEAEIARLRKALADCLEWMEETRASGDAGYWQREVGGVRDREWEVGGVYDRGRAALRTLPLPEQEDGA